MDAHHKNELILGIRREATAWCEDLTERREHMQVNTDISEYFDDHGNLLVRRKGERFIVTSRILESHEVPEVLDAMNKALEELRGRKQTA